MIKFETLDELEDLKSIINETLKRYSELYGIDEIDMELRQEALDKLNKYNKMLKDVLNEINKLK